VKTGALYAVYPQQLNIILANTGRERIPIRVLSRTSWVLPKAYGGLQEHQALPQARFRLTNEYGRETSFHSGQLVCWAEDKAWLPSERGPLAAIGPDAVRRLRALADPDLAHFRDYLFGVLRPARLRLDVISSNDLADRIPEDTL
jgi:hypothetical protein